MPETQRVLGLVRLGNVTEEMASNTRQVYLALIILARHWLASFVWGSRSGSTLHLRRPIGEYRQ